MGSKAEPCPTCGKPFHKRRKRFIETGSYGKVGRPRTSDWIQIYKLRDRGLSLSKISCHTGYGRGAIQHDLRNRETGGEDG